MQKKQLLIVLCSAATLLGCSSKPDASDVQSSLNEAWTQCKGLKFTELKKTNGTDQGKSYEMAISYKLEITKDATAQEAWYTDAICPSPSLLPLLWAYGKADSKFGKPLKTGDIINVNDVFIMVKSENGWIKQ